MSKLQIISDKNKKSVMIKNLLSKKIKSNNFHRENLIIVIGGDGFIANTKNKNTKKYFYGINSEIMVSYEQIFFKNIIKSLMQNGFNFTPRDDC